MNCPSDLAHEVLEPSAGGYLSLDTRVVPCVIFEITIALGVFDETAIDIPALVTFVLRVSIHELLVQHVRHTIICYGKVIWVASKMAFDEVLYLRDHCLVARAFSVLEGSKSHRNERDRFVSLVS